MKQNRKAEQTERSGRRWGEDGSAEGEERFRRFESLFSFVLPVQ